MLGHWIYYVFVLGMVSLNASEQFSELFDEQNEEEISQSFGAIEMDDFDSEGISLFGMDLEEGEEMLFPWGGREEFSAYVEEKAREALEDVDELFIGEATGPEMASLPSEEQVPTRSNRLLSGRPRIVPSNP
ncbi:MAG: hypothetical protein K940chlam2_00785 [Chlamydiae bacterium]|nr:hypothetical protein [Chlamydiota bacterium]